MLSPMIPCTLLFASCLLGPQAPFLPKLREELTGQKSQRLYRKITLKGTRPKDVCPSVAQETSTHVVSPSADKDKVSQPTFLPSSEPKAFWAGSSFHLCINFDAVLGLQSGRKL